MNFEWDAEKAARNLRKRGLPYETMKKARKKDLLDELRPECNFAQP